MARHCRTGCHGLYRQTNGRYYLDLRWIDSKTGQRERFTRLLPRGTTATAAKHIAREALRQTQMGQHPRRLALGATKRLHAALDWYLEWSANNRPRTLTSRTSLVRVLKKHLKNVPLRQLAPVPHIEGFKKTRRQAGAAPATINRAVALLKHAARLWEEQGWIGETQLQRIRKVAMLKEPPGRVRELTDREREKLFVALEEAQIRPIVVAALLSGLRRANLVGLRKDEVDLRRRMITTTRTKNNKRLTVPINDGLAQVLREAIRESGDSPYVFTNRQALPYTPDGFSSLWRRAKLAAGIKDLRFHDLRHDFASKVRRGGAGLDVVARLLGHNTLQMAHRYAHLSDETLKEAVAGLTA